MPKDAHKGPSGHSEIADKRLSDAREAYLAMMKHKLPRHTQPSKRTNGLPTPKSRRTGPNPHANATTRSPQTPKPRTTSPHTTAPSEEDFELESEDEPIDEPTLLSPRPDVTSTFRRGMDHLHRVLSEDNHTWIQEIANEDYDTICNLWTVMSPPEEMEVDENPNNEDNPLAPSSMARTCEWLTTEVDRYRQLNSQMEEAQLRMVRKVENLKTELATARSHSTKNIPLSTPPPTMPPPNNTYASAVNSNANNKTRSTSPKSTAERGHCQRLIVRPFPHIPVELRAEPDIIVDKLNELIEKDKEAGSLQVIGAKWNGSGNLILISDVNHTGDDLLKQQRAISIALCTERLKEVRLVIHTDAKRHALKANGVPTKRRDGTLLSAGEVVAMIENTSGQKLHLADGAEPRWLSNMDDRLKAEKSSIVITFGNEAEAKHFEDLRVVYILGRSCHISPFVERPPISYCRKCDSLKHREASCQSPRCGKCAKTDHPTADHPEEEPLQCINCSDAHESRHKNCPVRLKRLGISPKGKDTEASAMTGGGKPTTKRKPRKPKKPDNGTLGREEPGPTSATQPETTMELDATDTIDVFSAGTPHRTETIPDRPGSQMINKDPSGGRSPLHTNGNTPDIQQTTNTTK